MTDTPDQATTGNDDVFAIPIDRAAVRLYYIVLFCIACVGIAIVCFLFMAFIRFASSHNPFIPQLTTGQLLMSIIGRGFGFFVLYALVVTAVYFLFAKWLTEWQVDALQYRVEGKTLCVDWGVFFLQRKAIPLDRITDFALVQGPLMRILGIWAMRVQTASTGLQTPEATLIAIENPEKVRDELLRRRDIAAQGNRRDYA